MFPQVLELGTGSAELLSLEVKVLLSLTNQAQLKLML